MATQTAAMVPKQTDPVGAAEQRVSDAEAALTDVQVAFDQARTAFCEDREK
jgi:hypothetical protein